MDQLILERLNQAWEFVVMDRDERGDATRVRLWLGDRHFEEVPVQVFQRFKADGLLHEMLLGWYRLR